MGEERRSKRFHMTLQVPNLDQSIIEYSEIFNQEPCCVIPQRLALWRTPELNFLLRDSGKKRMAVLQLGWEYDYLDNSQRFKDINQLSWLFFATHMQDDAINQLQEPRVQYFEENDSLLELKNPSVRRGLGVNLILALILMVFTLLNYQSLLRFFREPVAENSPSLEEGAQPDPLKEIGSRLSQAGYTMDYLNMRGIAQHAKQASITLQSINGRILFSTYWTPQSKLSSSELISVINNINREALLCRYYLDEDKDLVIEAWVDPQQGEEAWLKTLALWQQESLEWISESPLFGGELNPKHSFSKR